MQRLVFSSEVYYIKAADLKKIASVNFSGKLPFSEDMTVLLLQSGGKMECLSSPDFSTISDDSYIPTKIAYYSYPAFISLLLTLIKPIKRKLYIQNSLIFRVRLSDIINADLPRGIRNETNAYQLNNKRWHINREEAHKKYETLKNSLQKSGYNHKHPMFVMLNRKLGAKDQLLQGHHRIGICKELGIEDVSISFWAAPATFPFFKKILDFIKKHKS